MNEKRTTLADALQLWRERLAQDPEAARVNVGEMVCPLCGDTLNVLKPARGCLVGETPDGLCHAACADEKYP